MSVSALTRGYSNARDVPFSFCRLPVPVVANGKLYVPTYDARINVYGIT
jgi:hypothetical protein